MIDAVAYEDALRRPSIVVRRGVVGRILVRLVNLLPAVNLDPERKKYVGRLLSHPEFEAFRARFMALDDLPEDAQPKAAEKALWDFCVAQRIPPDKVRRLPRPVQEAVVADFFISQARANGADLKDLPEAWAGAVEQVADKVREEGWNLRDTVDLVRTGKVTRRTGLN